MPSGVEQVEPQRIRLRDGAELLIRQVGPADKGLIAGGVERLSAKSRYRRFFRPLDRLSQRDLVYLTEIDHHDHEALAAIDPERGELIGVTRYVRSADPTEAEVSVVVRDDWQRRGLATALLTELTRRARANGVRRYTALVSADNGVVLEALERLGARQMTSPRRALQRPPRAFSCRRGDTAEPFVRAGKRLARRRGQTRLPT